MRGNLKPLDQLPIKYQLFVLGMITHKGDKTKAARSAGYSQKTCEQQGNRLFRKVKEYIEPLTKDLVKAYALKAEQVVQGLSLLASSDITDYMTWDSQIGNSRESFIFTDNSPPVDAPPVLSRAVFVVHHRR